MHICTLATDDYIPGTLALGQSLHENSGLSDIQLHILAPHGVSTENKEKLSNIPVSVSIWNRDWLVRYNFDKTLIPEGKKVNQFKFNVFRLPVKKVLFLDSDMLCLGNIEPIQRMSDLTAGLNIGKDHIRMVNNMPVFNTGCFVCEPNTDRFEDLQNFGSQWNEEIERGDQPIINRYYLENHPDAVDYLDTHWNVAMTCYKHRPHLWQEAVTRGIKFLHYTHTKPWSTMFPDGSDLSQYLTDLRNTHLRNRLLHYRKLISWWQPYYRRATRNN